MGKSKIPMKSMAVVAGLFAVITASASADTIRSSENYGIQFDSIAAGSGAMSSASYSQPQTIVGANVVWNHYISSSFDCQPVGVIQIPYNLTNALGWQYY